LLAAVGLVRVVTRDPKRAQAFADRGAQVPVADLGDPDSLRAAQLGGGSGGASLPPQYDFVLLERYGRIAIDGDHSQHSGPPVQ